MLFMSILGWILLSIIPGVIASRKGRSFVGYFVLSILLSPLIAGIIALVVSPVPTKQADEKLRDVKNKRCPFCGEVILCVAIKCRFCESMLSLTEPTAENETDPIDTTAMRIGRFAGKLFRYIARKPKRPV